MFTSRAEYRLSLRADNADQRLTRRGMELGLVGNARARHFEGRMTALETGRKLAARLNLTPSEAARHGIRLNQDGVRRNVFDLLAHPGMDFRRLAGIWPELGRFDRFVAEQIETEARYAVYLQRQAEDAERFRRDDAMPLPALDYAAIPGLSNELREKLARARPATVGQASRIDGMTPAAIMLLLTEAKRRRDRPAA
jgi:tRNA uridine 5-carboxymethylaminomethyl modification enzyme